MNQEKMRTAGQAVSLYGHYVSINVKSMMQYKTSFFLTAAGQFFVSFNVLIGVYFMFQRFPSVKGFTYSEVLLCFSIMLLEFSLAEMYARGFDAFSGIVKSGSFDQVLVRPRSEILQVLGSKFELTRFGRMLQAVAMFIYAVGHCDVQWSPAKILTVVFMLIGGIAVFTGLFLIYATFCFFTLDGLEFMNIFTDGAREFGRYPIGVYGEKVLLFTTFLIPYALIQYYPLLFILERGAHRFYMFLPLLAVLFLVPCHLFWRFGVSRYQSSGS